MFNNKNTVSAFFSTLFSTENITFHISIVSLTHTHVTRLDANRHLSYNVREHASLEESLRRIYVTTSQTVQQHSDMKVK